MLRVVSLFAFLSMVPLVLLTYLTLHLADQAVVREVNARVQTTAAVTSVLAQQGMGSIAAMAASYASRPVVIHAAADVNAAHFDNETINRELTQLQAAAPGIAGAFFTDIDCRLTQVRPATPDLVGMDFGFRDWCKGVKATGQPYVSEAYQTDIVGHPPGVAAAVLVRADGGAEEGRPLGILAVVYSLDFIRTFAAQVAHVQGVQLTITDQHGMVLVGPTSGADRHVLASAGADPRVNQALAGRSGVTRARTASGDTLSAFAPVGGIGWTVTAEIPARDALAGFRRLRSIVLSVAGLLGLVLMAGVVVLARTLWLRWDSEHALVEREARTGAILDAATDAFVSVDAAGTLTAWNRQAQEVFGWSENEALGRRLSDTIIPPEGAEEHDRRMAHFLATESPVPTLRTEITAMHKDGHVFPAELAIWRIGSGDASRLNAFIRDITERKQAVTDLADARDEALEASKMKSEFLATMSHEIRTPMNGVIGLTGLLLDTELSDIQRLRAEGVRASGEALLGIINDILDFSKIEAGKLELETVDFDLAHAVEEVAALVAESARAKGLELMAFCRPEVPVALRGDVGRLRQILLNFATNAVKFTEVGEVVVRAGLVGESTGEQVVVRVEVVDTGVGIGGAAAERLFEPFTQADASTTRRYGGTGLGLAISRRLADAMGGSVGVDSRPGGGSTFWACLPFARASAPIDDLDRSAHVLVGRRMLVVDDNQTNRLVLSSQLRAWGSAADLAADADQALACLRASVADGRPYDLALVDMAMPGMDGLDLARAIRADPELASTSLLLLSSVSVEAGIAAEAGFMGRLTKPVRLSSLYDALVRAVTPPSAASPSRPTAPAVTPGSRGTLLIVEDHAINQEVARGMVAKLGYRSDAAGDGIEALEALERRSYDAVLMDCHMPEMDGFDATAEVRRREAGRRRVPIIAMTAGATVEDREKCLAAGMDDYLFKPVKDRELAAVLDRWLRPPPHGVDQEAVGGGKGTVVDAVQFDGLRQLAEASEDPGFLWDLVNRYLDQAACQMAELRQATARGDAPAVEAVAHGLGGTSATMGACGVASACAVVEEGAARGEVTGPGDLDRIAVEVAWVTAALRAQTPPDPA